LFNLILASASPRRSELLRQIGVSFEVSVADVDESHRPPESITEYVSRLSREKAMAVHQQRPKGTAVLGADTAVTIHSELLGKPTDQNDARNMLLMLSGQTHWVHTGVTLVRGDSINTIVASTSVTFDTLSPDEVDAYMVSREWEGKAGGYAIQGRAARFVRTIAGSYTAVVGLPLWETYRLLKVAGYRDDHGQ